MTRPTADFAWPDVLGPLCAGEDLPADSSSARWRRSSRGEATDAQIAGFAVALRAKGETPAELAALVRTMLRFARAGRGRRRRRSLVDTCGTGGDRAGTVNVSTMAALVVAGAGVRVAKHGNRAASSQCGSADVLEALGVVIDLGPAGVAALHRRGRHRLLLRASGSTPRCASPARPARELGVPTTFNFLGPLANPAGVRRQVGGRVGPRDGRAGRRRARRARASSTRWCSSATTASTSSPRPTVSTVCELRDGEVHRYDARSRSTSGFGPRRARRASPAATPAANAAIAQRVLERASRAPVRDIVVLNAAAALVVAGAANDLGEGLGQADTSIAAGKAAAVLETFVRTSASAAARAADEG